MNNGYILLHRKLLDNPLASKPAWCYLWVILLFKASHESRTMMWNGKETEIKIGQFITGRKVLAELSGLSEGSVERCLNYLERVKQIEQQKTNKYRLITILNWKQYQRFGQQKNNKKTTDGQQMDTINELNELNELNKLNKEREEEQVGAKAPTPSQQAKAFFEGETEELMAFFLEKSPLNREVLKVEFQKFMIYWTEPNKSGTKVRWQQQNTFEVKRRLMTWLSRVKDYKNNKNTPNYVL